MERYERIKSYSSFMVTPRRWWQASAPKFTHNSPNPASIVYLTTTGANPNPVQNHMIKELQNIQEWQMSNGAADIYYNFLISRDGEVFEGRGWNIIPKLPKKPHRFASNCISIALIGNYKFVMPSDATFRGVHNLVKLGIQRGFIQKKYIEYTSSFWSIPCFEEGNEILRNVLH